MANFHRLIFALLFFPALVQAAITPTGQTWRAGSCSGVVSRATAAEIGDYYCGANAWNVVTSANATTACTSGGPLAQVFFLKSTGDFCIAAYLAVSGSCPANSTLSSTGSTCTCNSGYTESGSSCVATAPTDPCASLAGTTQKLTFKRCTDTNGNDNCDASENPVYPPPPLSSGNCGYTWNAINYDPADVKCWTLPPAHEVYCSITYTNTGGTVAPTSTNTPADSSVLGNCPAGQSPLTVGGNTYCFQNETSTSETNTVQKDAAGNVTSSGTESKTTTLDTATKKVSETTTHADGTKSVITQDASTYCKNNPNAEVCKAAGKQATSSNDCAVEPSCSGDAIQCASLKQQWQIQCELKNGEIPDTDANYLAGQGAITAGQGVIIGEPSTLNVSGQISQQTFLGGSCVTDLAIDLGSHGTFNIPFSQLCSTFEIMGNILVAIAMLGAARITGIL